MSHGVQLSGNEMLNMVLLMFSILLFGSYVSTSVQQHPDYTKLVL